MSDEARRVQLHPLVQEMLGNVVVDDARGPQLSPQDFDRWVERCRGLRGAGLEVFAHLGALAVEMARKGADVFSLQCLTLCSIGARADASDQDMDRAKQMADSLQRGATGSAAPGGLATPGGGVGLRRK